MDSGQNSPKYQLIAELGHGGMADVFLAVLKGPTDFTKLAVVKRLRSHLAEDPEFLAMFLQEARIAARLNHPNVVHTFEVGHDGKHHFIAMEYLEGHAYSALLSRVGREQLDFGIQLRILIESLEGLQYAHDLKDFDGRPLGVVHRDVSPQNIFVTYDGQIKILDFGIAKALDSAVETRTGVIKGKLSYMSPEQALGGDVDRRSDVYAIGVVLWEAIAGRRRWKGASNVEMMKKLVSTDEPLQLPDPTARGLPAALTDVMKRALAREPADRYAEAADMQADLESVLEKLGKRVTSRDVGKYVAETFGEDRQRVLKVIENALKKVETPTVRPGSSSSIDLPPLDLPPNSISASNTLESPGATEQSAAISVPQDKTPPAKRRWPYVIVAVAAAAAAAAVFGIQQQRSRAAAAPPPAPSAAEQQEIGLRLSASPAAAQIYFDEQRLGANPHVSRMPRAEREVSVRAELAGYVPETRTVLLTKDVEVHFELQPVRTEAAPPEQAAKASTRRHKPWVAAPKATAVTTPPKTEPDPPAISTTAKPAATTRPGVVLDTELPWGSKK